MTASDDRQFSASTEELRNHRVAVRGRLLIVLAVLAGVAATYAARALVRTDGAVQWPGLRDAGPVTATGMAVGHYAIQLTSTVVAGLLFLRCLISSEAREAGAQHLMKAASRWSWAWVVSSVGWILFSISDLAGVPISQLPSQGNLTRAIAAEESVVVQVGTAWVALAVAFFATRLATRRHAGAAAAAASLAVVINVLLGHAESGSAGGHASGETFELLATASLAVHVVAAALWVGGLFGLVVHLRRFPRQLRQALPRFSVAALACVVAIGATGVVQSAAHLPGWSALLTTAAGLLIVAKAAALALLAVLGHLHRQRTVAAAVSGHLVPLLRLAAAELVLMSATVGIAVVLSATT